MTIRTINFIVPNTMELSEFKFRKFKHPNQVKNLHESVIHSPRLYELMR